MKQLGFGEQVEALGASDRRVRHEAAVTLYNQGKAALETLIVGTTHMNWRVRRGCANLMDHLADERCIEPLLRLLNDPIQSVRRLALHSLSCQGCKVCPLNVDIVAHLIDRALNDGSIQVRRVAVHQLGCQPADERATIALRTMLQNDTDEKLLSRARWALTKHSYTRS